MYRYIKRSLDMALSFALLLLLLPFNLILCLAIRLDSPGPVLFLQRRIGRDQKPFLMFKFRTMWVDAPPDVPTHRMETPAKWITPLGRILRKTSIDELPQLLNILRGDMALVGPRPALWNQYDLIEAREKYPCRYGGTANSVRPGLTGWAQVNGRDRLDIPVKAAYDGEYVQRMSFLFDVRCLLRTALHVVTHSGVREGGEEVGDR